MIDDNFLARVRLARQQAHTLRQQQIERRAEAEAQRKLALQVISAGYRGLAAKLGP
jgi:hypothetical protein